MIPACIDRPDETKLIPPYGIGSGRVVDSREACADRQRFDGGSNDAQSIHGRRLWEFRHDSLVAARQNLDLRQISAADEPFAWTQDCIGLAPLQIRMRVEKPLGHIEWMQTSRQRGEHVSEPGKDRSA